MRIPHASLQPTTLRAVVEEFITREGTDYGDGSASIDDKVKAVMTQLETGAAYVVYDETTETCTLMLASAEPFIQLDQFLKREGLTETGGHAKHAIQGGEVAVNGEVDTRRKRKLRSGDVVTFDGKTLTVTL